MCISCQRTKCTFHLTHKVHIMHFVAMSTIQDWLGDKRDDQWLAQAIGCSRSQASRIRRGESRPSPERAFLIEKLSRGKVKAAELLTGQRA